MKDAVAEIQTTEICPHCMGSGEGAASQPCWTCNGTGGVPQTTDALFTDCRFYYSVTLEYADWQAIIAVLRSGGQPDLANKVESTFGLRPE